MNHRRFVREYALGEYQFRGDSEDYLVARLINRHTRGCRVLDLGCGPVVPILSVFLPEAEELVAVDRLLENLQFMRDNKSAYDDVRERALAYKHRYLQRTDAHPRIKFVQGDFTRRLRLGHFDSVMQIGAFGAVDTAADFEAAVRHAYAYLKPGGSLVMLNWYGDAARPAGFNGRVREDIVYRPALENAGFMILELHKTSKLGDTTRQRGYEGIIWAVARKPTGAYSSMG